MIARAGGAFIDRCAHPVDSSISFSRPPQGKKKCTRSPSSPPPKQSSERMAVFLLWNKEASIQASLFSHSEIPKFLKGNIKFDFKLIIPVYPDRFHKL